MAGKRMRAELGWITPLVVLGLSLCVGCQGPSKMDDDAANPGASMEGEAQNETANAGGGESAPIGGGERSTARGGNQDRVDGLLDEMERELTQRQQEALYYKKQADRWFKEADYYKAEQMYRKALELDPGLTEAQQKLVDSMMFLGKRDGEIQTTIETFAAEVNVATQERVAEARRFIALGEKAYGEGDLDSALDKLTRAREMFLWYSYEGVEDIDADREKAQRLYDEVRMAAEEAARNAALAEERDARDEADRLRQLDERNRSQRIEGLMQRAHEAMASKEYERAVDLTTTVLDIEQGETEARQLQRKAKRLANAPRYVRYLENDREQTIRVGEGLEVAGIPYDEPFTFPDREEWNGVIRRREETLATANLDESYDVRKIRQVLATQSADFDFKEQSLAEVVGFLRQIADLNITIDPEIDAAEAEVSLSLTGVKLEEALDLILKNIGLAYTFRENTLYITEKEKAYGNTIFDIYNVTDILNKIRDFPGPQIRVRSNDESDDGGTSPFGFDEGDEDDSEPLDPESLAELIITSTGGEELWEESASEIQGHRGQLLVNATRELHISVKNFLQNLRQDSDLFVIVEARFIDMTDDFLEDIGIDTRNLGQPAGTGFGTAYGILNSAGTGGVDPGFNNLGNPTNPSLLMGQDRVAGRIQHILDGFVGAATGTSLDSALKGLTLQVTWLDPFQINAILRASQETRVSRTVTAPRITASNGQRVHVSVITQRAYVQDYELVSGGTGMVVQEVADPVVATFQEGVILDVQPVISSDRKYISIDVRPTIATLINGVISTVTISLGSLQQAAQQVDIDLPEIALQQAFTSVTVPDGGTVLLGGFRSMNERKYESYVPIIGKLPILKNAFRRKATIDEKRSLYILLTARAVDLRSEESRLFN